MANPSPTTGVGNVHKPGPVQVRKPAPKPAPKPQGRKGGKR